MALPIVAILAVAGWGAFLWERLQPTSLLDVVPADTTAALTGWNNPLTEHVLPARALAAFAPLAADRRAPAPSTPPAVAASTNISGSWTLTRAVESSSYDAFTGMTFGYELRLQQRGGRVTGSGTRRSAKRARPREGKSGARAPAGHSRGRQADAELHRRDR